MTDIKRLAESDQLTIGAETTLKALRTGHLQKIIMASNAPIRERDGLVHEAKLAKIPVEISNLNNQDLGTACKRTHAISILGQKK